MNKKYLLLVLLTIGFLVGSEAFAQEKKIETEAELVNAVKFSKLDKSPLDITYLRKSRKSSPLAKVHYGRPQKKEREIFGGIVSYGKIWRTGANEATEVTFYKDLEFAGKPLKAGTYVLHTIPGEKEWVIILNSNLNVWGAYQYDETADVLRVTVPVGYGKRSIEAFAIAFKKGEKPAMVLAWDLTRVEIPISFE
jgi:hypothetical protein